MIKVYLGNLTHIRFFWCLTIALLSVAIHPRHSVAAELASAEDSRNAITGQVANVTKILQMARDGKQISQLTLGMMIADLLSDLCAQDQELDHYFHRENQFIETYLINKFQYRSADEVAAIEAMAQNSQNGQKSMSDERLAARWGLESLRHIPNSDDPVAKQEQVRQALVVALTTLESLLRTIAGGDRDINPPG